jgi:Tfp pilus assembly protein PilO
MKITAGQHGPYKGWQIDVAGAAVCIVLTIGAYLLGVAPALHRSAQVQEMAHLVEVQRAEAADLARSRDQLKQHLHRMQTMLDQAAFRLEPISRLNPYLAQLTDLATRSGMALHEIKPGKPSRSQYYRSTPIRLSGSGSYRSCAVFLHNIRDEFSATRVSSFQLAALNNSPNPEARITLELTWHTALGAITDQQ